MTLYLKDPQGSLDYTIDWAAGYLSGQSVVTSLWSVLPAEADGLVVVATLHDGARTSATLEGGVAGHVYRVTNHVVLSDGRADERSLAIRVEQR